MSLLFVDWVNILDHRWMMPLRDMLYHWNMTPHHLPDHSEYRNLEKYRNNSKYWDRQTWANNVDRDQTSQKAASDQGLYCSPHIQHYFKHINRQKNRLLKFEDKGGNEFRCPKNKYVLYTDTGMFIFSDANILIVCYYTKCTDYYHRNVIWHSVWHGASDHVTVEILDLPGSQDIGFARDACIESNQEIWERPRKFHETLTSRH